MSVTSVVKNSQTRTMTVTAQFDAHVERVWQVWSDPRQLERWWGPPTYPATVLDHDLTPGGSVTYLMTGPEGDKYHGWWSVVTVRAPHLLEFEDGFGEESGSPAPGLPITGIQVTLNERPDGGTLMQITSTFPSLEAMQQLLTMGIEEGLAAALNQIDGMLVE